MEEKYFLDEKGLKELGEFLRQYYVSDDKYFKDYVELYNKVVYLEKPKVLPDNTDIKDIKTDGLYVVNGITLKDSPVLEEFTDYQADRILGTHNWYVPPYISPYMLLKVRHMGEDILYFLFDSIFDITHYAVFNSKRDRFSWRTKYFSFSRRNDIIDLINTMFEANPSLTHIANDEYIDGWNLSSPYIQQAELHYNSDNITAKVTVNYDAGKIEYCEEENEGTFLLGATENSAGVMSADDKKKLNSIDIEKYAQQEKDIQTMKEEITQLKTQIEKLQASINNKE
uniref:Uncharacterized protein n=1 Tax=Firmicutes phage HS16 TaxID=3056394 RepID=A0AA49X4Q5_9VIRU|nr:MAG: hypothetical protein [Firmicutes phage HS16]